MGVSDNSGGFVGGYANNNQQDPFSQPQRTSQRQMESVPSSLKTSKVASNKEQLETELIKDLLSSYFGIVRKNIMDSVPKTVMYFLVNESKKALQHELVSELYREDLFAELLRESDSISVRRDSCKKTLEVLKKANDILNSVRDYSMTGQRNY